MTLLRNYRLERAKDSLEKGYRVNITANKCGFNSVTYFSKTCKSMFGVTPSEYKKNYLKGNLILKFFSRSHLQSLEISGNCLYLKLNYHGQMVTGNFDCFILVSTDILVF